MKSKRAHLLLLTTVLVAGPAVARTPVLITPSDVQPYHFYGSISGNYASAPRSPLGYLETCDMTGPGPDLGDCSSDDTIVPFVVNDSHVNEYGGGATIGYGLAPMADGGKPRVEFGFNYLTGDQTTSRSARLSGNFPFLPGSKNLLLHSIDGKKFYSNDDYLDVDASIRTKQDEANLVLRYLVDYDAGSRTKITPFVGFVAGMLRTRFDAKGMWVDPSTFLKGRDDTVLSSLSERIRTNYFGVEWGAQVSYDLTDSVKLFGAAQASVLHQSAKLTGRDCQSREFVPGFVPAACVHNPVDDGFATTATDKITDWNPAFALSAGISFEVSKGITLGLTGFASYDTNYRVVNPGGTKSDTPPLAPAHLEEVQRWTPGAQITLSFAL